MNENDKEKIWAYVDGEMSKAERDTFERALASDLDLAREVEVVRRFDQSLSSLIPIAEQKEEALEAQILNAFENRPESAPQLERAIVETRERTDFFQLFCSRFLMPAFAVAACIVIGIGISARTAGPLRWIDAGGLATVRGPADSPYSPEELGRLRATVQTELVIEYRRQADTSESSLLWGLKSHWYWDVRIAPTADGALLVQVAIRETRDGGAAKEWTQTFSNAEDLKAKVGAWAHAVVEESRAAR